MSALLIFINGLFLVSAGANMIKMITPPKPINNLINLFITNNGIIIEAPIKIIIDIIKQI